MTNNTPGPSAPGPILNPDGSLGGIGKLWAGPLGFGVAQVLDQLLLEALAGYQVTLSKGWAFTINVAISVIAIMIGVYKAHPDWEPAILSWIVRNVRQPGAAAARLPLGLVVVVVAGMTLAACAAGTPVAPPATPQAADISAEATAVAAINTAGTSPQGALNLGVELATDRCHQFFDALVQQSENLNFASNAVTAGTAAATGVATATKANPMVAALMGIILPTIATQLQAAAVNETAGLDPGAVSALVENAQAQFLGALPGAPTDATQAVLWIKGYAYQCSLTKIRQLALSSVINAKVSASTTAAPGAVPNAAGLPARAIIGLPVTRVAP